MSTAMHAALEQLPEAEPTELLHRVVFAWAWLTAEEQALVASTIAHLTHPRRQLRAVMEGRSWAA
jgi:hypothetical protein